MSKLQQVTKWLAEHPIVSMSDSIGKMAILVAVPWSLGTWYFVDRDARAQTEVLQMYGMLVSDKPVQLRQRALDTLIDERGQRDFSGLFLNNIDFSGKEIFNFDFTGAKLEEANFQNAKIVNTKFDAAKLKEANFQETNLQTVQFNGADLYGASFNAATGKSVFFIDAEAVKTFFTGTSFELLNMDGANLSRATIYPDVIWQGADIKRATLDNALMYDIDLTGSNFSSSSFKGTKLHRATLSNVRFNSGNLECALLPLSKLDGANLSAANLRGTYLSNVTAEGVILTESVRAPSAEPTFVEVGPEHWCAARLDEELREKWERQLGRCIVEAPNNTPC